MGDREEESSSQRRNTLFSRTLTFFEVQILLKRLRHVCLVFGGFLIFLYIITEVDLVVAIYYDKSPIMKYIPNYRYRHPVVAFIIILMAMGCCCLYIYGVYKRNTKRMWPYLLTHLILLFDLYVEVVEGIVQATKGQILLTQFLGKVIVVIIGSFIMFYIYDYFAYLLFIKKQTSQLPK